MYEELYDIKLSKSGRIAQVFKSLFANKAKDVALYNEIFVI